jgi:predicted GNAT superfamily acetyltransferase
MLEFRELITTAERELSQELFDKTWPNGGTQIPTNFLQALLHSGSYLGGGFESGKLVAAAFAFPGLSKDGEIFLHSHVAAVDPDFRDQGAGSGIKGHQRKWAQAKGYRYIGWTFDPLVSRNARLNIVKLGAEITEYLVDFYGEMPDAVNAGDATDRLYVKWYLDKELEEDENTGKKISKTITEKSDDILVEIPEDILTLRSVDLEAAKQWRREVRSALEPKMKSGWKITGFTEKREYILSKP